MFCENCGKKIPEGAAFCVNCGAKIQLSKKMESNNINLAEPVPQARTGKEMPLKKGIQQQKRMQQAEMPRYPREMVQQSAYKKTKKPMSVLTKIIVAEFVIVVILGIFFTMKLKEYISPEYVAKQYFAAIMSGDGKRAYQMVQVEDDDFINEEQFQNVVEDMSNVKISNFQVKKESEREEQDSYTRYIEIAYRLKEDTSNYNMHLTLEKSDEKKWLIFDDWKVNIGNHIAKNISIETNKDSKISIEGKELSSENISGHQNETGNMVYTIPRMFEGKYNVVITNDMYEDIIFEMNVEKDDEEQNYSKVNGTLKKETVEKVMEAAKTDFKTLWENAGEKKSFSEVKVKSAITENSEVQNQYENVMNGIADEKTMGVKNLDFEELQVTAQQKEDYDSDIPYITVQFVSNVKYTSVTENYWTGTLVESQESKEGYTASFDYVYQDDGWKLYGVDMDL